MDLVFGASGYIGSNLVPLLLREGRRVRASSRHIEVLQDRSWYALLPIHAFLFRGTTREIAARTETAEENAA